MIWDRLIPSLLCSMQWMKGRRRKSHHYLWYSKYFLCGLSYKDCGNKKKHEGKRKTKQEETKEPQGKFYLQKPNWHFISFGPNTLSKAVQGSVPHWYLLAGFEDLVLEEGGCGQALMGLSRISSLVQKQMPGCCQWPYTAGRAGKASGYQAPGPC